MPREEKENKDLLKLMKESKTMNQDEWLKWRKQGIGGSDVAGIMGLSNWASPLSVYLDKTDEEICYETNDMLEIGKEIEYVIHKLFEKKAFKKVKACSFESYTSKEHKFILASPDGILVDEKAGVEFKNASEYRVSDFKDKIPDNYLMQIQHYMYVLDYPVWYIAVLIGGNKFVWYPVERNENLIKQMVEACVAFWNDHVLKRIAPPPGHLDIDNQIVNKQYPKAIENQAVDISTSTDLIRSYLDLKDHNKTISKELKTMENLLKIKLGDAAIGLSDDYKITWKNMNITRLDNKSLQLQLPDIYEKYSHVKLQRRFNVKKQKEI